MKKELDMVVLTYNAISWEARPKDLEFRANLGL